MGFLFAKPWSKLKFFQKEITAEISEAAPAVIKEDSEDHGRIIHDLNGRIRIKFLIRHDNSHIKTFRSKIRNRFCSRNLPVSNLEKNFFKIKILGSKPRRLRIQFFNLNQRLKTLLLSQYIREAYEHTERKGHPQIA